MSSPQMKNIHSYTRRRAIGSGLCLAFASPIISFAKEREKVQWAGVSLAGQWESASILMPAVHSLIIDDAFRLKLNDRVTSVLRGQSGFQSRFEFVTEGALSRQGADAYALTLAITGEFVSSVEAMGADGVPFQELSVRLRGLVMMANVSMDPMRQRVVCSYPIRTAYRTRLPGATKVKAQETRRIIESMLMGELGPNSDFVAKFKERVPMLMVRERDEWVTVSPLRITPEVASRSGLSTKQQEHATALASSVLEAGISSAANIPIVPASADGSLNELKLSFADRGGMAFRNPDPSFSLDVSVYVLASQTAEQQAQTLRGYVTRFVGGFQVDYSKIDGDKRRDTVVSLRLQKQAAITYFGSSVDARKFEIGDQYLALITLFSEDLVQNLIPANEKWLDQHRAGSETKSARQMFELIRKELPSPSRGS